MSKKEKTTEPYFATSMQDMGGNTGHTPENEVLWDIGNEKKPKSESK